MSVVGLDLGTTNTVVAYVRSGKVHVLADERGQRLLPSVVSFHPNGEVLVGGAAKSRRVIDPKNTVYSHKRLIGRSWGSPEIVQAKQRFAFELREGPGQGPLVHARGQDYTLPEISAFVLKRARQISETALGTPVERAVITVPAHFNELQRASTKVAGRVSGLEVLRILNEPTAAALAYGLGRTGSERVAVYDFGGGTFDCTLLDLNGNVFEVLATAGDSLLGGDDVDMIIAERMAETFLKQHRQDPRQDPHQLERLRVTAEEIKMALSTAETHTVVLKEFGFGAGGVAINFTFTLTRRDLDAAIMPLVDRTFKVTQDALALARLTPTGFDKVILVGGSTRIPIVKKRVEAFFGAPPMDRVNPDEVVAVGAAIQAASLTEGSRKRSIPAPPPVPGQARTLPGVQSDAPDATHTSELDPSKLKPAFSSNPPAFGFGPGSQQPPQTKSGPPPVAQGVPGARPRPSDLAGTRKLTNPGVASATQPMGARQAPKPISPAQDEDPSIASFPDLALPAPFEWFPLEQPPSDDDTQRRTGPTAQSERSSGGNTITKAGAVEPNTLTAMAAAPGSGSTTGQMPGPRPAAGAPPPTSSTTGVATQPDSDEQPTGNAGKDFGGFGAIDEPPSLYSTPSASVPSFPSMMSGQGGVPSPIGDEPPTPEMPAGQFGAVKDLSLLSSSGVSTSGVSQSGMQDPSGQFGQVRDLSLVSSSSGVSGQGNPSEPGPFGKVSDLSLISPSTATPEMDAITAARKKAVEAGTFEDDTEVPYHADLPAVVETADLPSVVAKGKRPGEGKRPAVRKASTAGMTATGDSAMLGKPPPPVAPQPFGPMEKFPEERGVPPTRTVNMPGAPPNRPPPAAVQAKTVQSRAQQPVKPPPAPPSSANPARTLETTAPIGQQAPPVPGAPAAAFGSVPPMQAGFGNEPFGGVGAAGAKTAAFGSTAPIGQQAPSPPPPAFQSAPPMNQGFGEPHTHQGFASAPPMQQQGGFGSAPPPGQQQGPGGSQPPIFGSRSSSPPAPQAHGQDFGQPGQFDPGIPQAPAAPHAQHLGFAAPVLVDVTPRALVVETAGGYTDTIIPRNSKIPCERTRRFATGRDMQTTVRVRVAQGEHQYFPQNTYLGEVELSGLRPAPRGDVTVAVTFEVDADGTLRVRARDVQTGQEARAALQLVGIADESSVVMMINRFAQQPVSGGGPS